MNVIWIFLFDVVLLTRFSAAIYMSKCALVAAGSIAYSIADLNLYVEDDEEDIYAFVKKQQPKKEEPKEDEVTRITRFQKECINKTKVQPELIEKLNRGNWQLNIPTLKEWAFCVLNKLGLMSMQGVYRLDVAFSRIPKTLKQTAEDLIDKCLISDDGIPPIQIAWTYLTCLNNEDPKGVFSKLGIFYNISSDIK